jgi:geranylgeranyl transferase type-2 subunit beta
MNRRQAIGADLLLVSGRATRVLDRAARARIAAFLGSCVASGGGFRGRGAGPAADLYYTLFGAVAGNLVGADSERRALGLFLEQQSPESLDLPHLAALVQCQRLRHLLGIPRRQRVPYLQAVSRFRSLDGGFGDSPGGARGSAYALYLAVLCHEALGTEIPADERASAVAAELLREELDSATGSLSRAVSATLVQQALGVAVPTAELRQHIRLCGAPGGGFRAHPRAPVGDLLSTAVASFALRRLGSPLCGPDAARTAQFVQSLWDVGGGFGGSAGDSTPDCEYTFYGLLALGALEP